MRPHGTERRSQLVSIQCLRGVAALLVLFHHVRIPTNWLFDPLEPFRFGTGGVDLFFVVSGFIMIIAAREESVGGFVVRRVVRIVPLYWLATFAYIAVLMLLRPWADAPLSTGTVVRSLLFIPYYRQDFAVPTPILVPGWTLNFEMAFYAVFAVGLACRRPLLVAGAILVILIGVGVLLHDKGPMAAVWTSPLLSRFLGGMLLGQLHLSVGLRRFGLLLPIGAVGLLVCAMPLAARIDHLALLRGLSAIAVVAGAVALEDRFAAHVPQLPKQLGDASYSLYLSHWPVLAALHAAHGLLPAYGWCQFLLWMVIGLSVPIVAGLLVHRWVEAPMTQLFRRLVVQPLRAGNKLTGQRT
ncbi:acyltransferase family protein [Flavisphingomonas formosensis]|uniref:acyltransferase family protein n=1 Tax=Flavisphingomonas formosensis TaxID=861534 RepID=UPI0012FBB399|nr:acyltransferase [Sphingomonas formosensis]